MIELVAIPYSPWSERARWSLDHHSVQYLEESYVPMLGEPALRTRLKQWRGKVSVPILFANDMVIRDSFEIARYADGIGAGGDLFPAGAQEPLRHWNECSERALCAIRAMVSRRVLADPAARSEAVPMVHGAVASALRPLANVGVSYLRKKYDFGKNVDEHHTILVEALRRIRRELAKGRGEYLLGDAFSFADMAMAVCLQGVKPVTDEFLLLGPATRSAWTDEELASEFADLVEWRDRLYERHRHSHP